MFIFGLTSVAEFMENLFLNIDKSAETIGLLQTSFEKTKESCRNRAKEQLKKLHDRNYTAGTTTSRRIVQFLYAVQRICGGTYQVTTGTDLSYIIAQGVARVYDSEDRFRLADPVFVDVLFEFCKDIDGIIIDELSKLVADQKALTSQDQSSKGFSTERALSWIVQQHKIPHPSTACTAGTTLELFGPRCNQESEASLLIKIALGEEDKVVFPSTSAGPDLWYRGKINENEFAVVAIQSKCH